MARYFCYVICNSRSWECGLNCDEKRSNRETIHYTHRNLLWRNIDQNILHFQKKKYLGIGSGCEDNPIQRRTHFSIAIIYKISLEINGESCRKYKAVVSLFQSIKAVCNQFLLTYKVGLTRLITVDILQYTMSNRVWQGRTSNHCQRPLGFCHSSLNFVKYLVILKYYRIHLSCFHNMYCIPGTYDFFMKCIFIRVSIFQ